MFSGLIILLAYWYTALPWLIANILLFFLTSGGVFWLYFVLLLITGKSQSMTERIKKDIN